MAPAKEGQLNILYELNGKKLALKESISGLFIVRAREEICQIL